MLAALEHGAARVRSKGGKGGRQVDERTLSALLELRERTRSGGCDGDSGEEVARRVVALSEMFFLHGRAGVLLRVLRGPREDAGLVLSSNLGVLGDLGSSGEDLVSGLLGTEGCRLACLLEKERRLPKWLGLERVGRIAGFLARSSAPHGPLLAAIGRGVEREAGAELRGAGAKLGRWGAVLRSLSRGGMHLGLAGEKFEECALLYAHRVSDNRGTDNMQRIVMAVRDSATATHLALRDGRDPTPATEALILAAQYLPSQSSTDDLFRIRSSTNVSTMGRDFGTRQAKQYIGISPMTHAAADALASLLASSLGRSVEEEQKHNKFEGDGASKEKYFEGDGASKEKYFEGDGASKEKYFEGDTAKRFDFEGDTAKKHNSERETSSKQNFERDTAKKHNFERDTSSNHSSKTSSKENMVRFRSDFHPVLERAIDQSAGVVGMALSRIQKEVMGVDVEKTMMSVREVAEGAKRFAGPNAADAFLLHIGANLARPLHLTERSCALLDLPGKIPGNFAEMASVTSQAAEVAMRSRRSKSSSSSSSSFQGESATERAAFRELVSVRSPQDIVMGRSLHDRASLELVADIFLAPNTVLELDGPAHFIPQPHSVAHLDPPKDLNPTTTWHTRLLAAAKLNVVRIGYDGSVRTANSPNSITIQRKTATWTQESTQLPLQRMLTALRYAKRFL